MEMHSLLFVLDEPKDQNSDAYEEWCSCCLKTHDKLSKIPQQSVDILAKNVIMLHVQDGISMLGELLQCAEQYSASYKILYFESEPAWSSFSAASVSTVEANSKLGNKS